MYSASPVNCSRNIVSVFDFLSASLYERWEVSASNISATATIWANAATRDRSDLLPGVLRSAFRRSIPFLGYGIFWNS